MADMFSSTERSELMRRIRSSGTKIEVRLHELVRAALGPRWRIDQNARDLPGVPDILVPSLRLAIFADGCFYHSCPTHGRPPKSNRGYWVPKLARNVRRDRRSRRALRVLGYAVWRFWEHDLTGRAVAKTLLALEHRLAKRKRDVRSERATASGGRLR